MEVCFYVFLNQAIIVP